MVDQSPPGHATASPPGWYPHPEHPGLLYEWDGQAWTGQTQHAAAPLPALACAVCGNQSFRSAEMMLNTRGMTFFGLDAFNSTAVCRICNRCGFIHWFAPPNVGT